MDLPERVALLEQAVIALGAARNPLPQPTDAEAKNAKPPVKGDNHPPVGKQVKRWQQKDGKVPGHYGADNQELGDVSGHDFHGGRFDPNAPLLPTQRQQDVYVKARTEGKDIGHVAALEKARNA